MKFVSTKITPPKSVDECTEMNNVTLNLERWANRLEVLGTVICVIISIFGIIMAFVEQDVYTNFRFGIFIKSLLSYALYAFIAYCSCHATALIISAIGMITYNTMVTAKASLLNDSFSKYNNTSETESQKTPKNIRQMITETIGYKECPHDDKYKYLVYKDNLSGVRIELCAKCKVALIQNGFNVIDIDNDGK